MPTRKNSKPLDHVKKGHELILVDPNWGDEIVLVTKTTIHRVCVNSKAEGRILKFDRNGNPLDSTPGVLKLRTPLANEIKLAKQRIFVDQACNALESLDSSEIPFETMKAIMELLPPKAFMITQPPKVTKELL